MGSIDLKDAYYSVPLCEERFHWALKLYQYRVLPNGLACAPSMFTKLLTPIYASLKEEGGECFPYIDDSIIVADGRRAVPKQHSSWAPVGPSWAPVGPQLGLTGAHLGMLLW